MVRTLTLKDRRKNKSVLADASEVASLSPMHIICVFYDDFLCCQWTIIADQHAGRSADLNFSSLVVGKFNSSIQIYNFNGIAYKGYSNTSNSVSTLAGSAGSSRKFRHTLYLFIFISMFVQKFNQHL